MSIFKKIFKKVPNPIKKIPNPFKKAKSKIPVINKVHDKIDKAKDDVQDKIKEAVDKALKEALEAAKDLASPVVQKAFSAALRKLLSLSHLAPVSVGFEGQAIIGIGFDFNLQAALDHVRKWADSPPKSKNDLKQFIIDLAPTHVKIFGGGAVALGFELSVSGNAVWEKEYLIKNWDKITS